MVSFRNYFTILILLVMIFVLFMFTGVSAKLLMNTSANSWADEQTNYFFDHTGSEQAFNLAEHQGGQANDQQKPRVAVLAFQNKDSSEKLFVEWCYYHKYLYKVFDTWPTAKEISDFDIVLFGDIDIGMQKLHLLNLYSEQGVTMIFTKLPEYEEIAGNKELASFFGIKTTVSERVEVDGIRIFSGFMMNKERIYKKNDYFGEKDDTTISIPFYDLRTGFEIYATGYYDEMETEEAYKMKVPPLIWRTVTNQSLVFAVNSDIFEDVILLGVLSGFMSQRSEINLYPIINAQTITLLSYPYFSNENSQKIEEVYSRATEAIARDLLWPNIVQVLKNYGSSNNFFAAPQLNYLDETGPKNDYTDFYMNEISKLPGMMGLSLAQTSDAPLETIIAQNKQFFRESMPDYDITALYLAGFEQEELSGYLEDEFLKHVSLVMSDYQEGDSLISLIDQNVLSVKFNQNGYRHETMDDLVMCSLESSLGMCNSAVDMLRVFYPEDDHDQWNYLTKKWSKGKTYYHDFAALDMVSIYEMEKRIRRFLALDYTYQYQGDKVELHIDHFDETAYFILTMDRKKIASIQNATAEKISDHFYLIKANGADVSIQLVEEKVLGWPANHRQIPMSTQ